MNAAERGLTAVQLVEQFSEEDSVISVHVLNVALTYEKCVRTFTLVLIIFTEFLSLPVMENENFCIKARFF